MTGRGLPSSTASPSMVGEVRAAYEAMTDAWDRLHVEKVSARSPGGVCRLLVQPARPLGGTAKHADLQVVSLSRTRA